MWNVNNGVCTRTLDGHARSVSAILVIQPASNNDKTERLVSAGVDGTIHVWDLKTFERVATFADAHKGEVAALGFVASKRLLVSASNSDGVKVWHHLNASISDSQAAQFSNLLFHAPFYASKPLMSF